MCIRVSGMYIHWSCLMRRRSSRLPTAASTSRCQLLQQQQPTVPTHAKGRRYSGRKRSSSRKQSSSSSSSSSSSRLVLNLGGGHCQKGKGRHRRHPSAPAPARRLRSHVRRRRCPARTNRKPNRWPAHYQSWPPPAPVCRGSSGPYTSTCEALGCMQASGKLNITVRDCAGCACVFVATLL